MKNFLLKLLVKVTRNASKKLVRDFYEIESFQNSQNNKISFVKSSIEVLKSSLLHFLSQYNELQAISFNHNVEYTKGRSVLILPIDNIELFFRARNSFGMLFLVYEDNEPMDFFLYFPLLGDYFYTQDSNLYLEKFLENRLEKVRRLKMPSSYNITNNLLGLFDISLMNNRLLDIYKVEIYNAPLHLLQLFCLGKLDIIFLPNNKFYVDLLKILNKIKLFNFFSQAKDEYLIISNHIVDF